MTSAISSGRAGGVTATRLGGSGGAGGAGAAMSGIAAGVASAITAELQLAVDPDGRRKQDGSAHDLYDIEEASEALTTSLGGSKADQGRISQSLHRFAQEIASLMVARPDSRSLETVERAIAGSMQGADVPSVAAVLQVIDRTTHQIAGK
jgi:hypothetical protein